MITRPVLALLPFLLGNVYGLPQASSSSASTTASTSSAASTTASTSSTAVASLTVSTAVASVSGPSTAPVPSQSALLPIQAWCPSEIFCAGELLQTVNLADLYSDPKTFVDKPTFKPSQQVLSDFAALNDSTITEGDILNFVDTDFQGEGLELEALSLTDFNPSPAFLENVTDPLLKAWSQTVHGYWTQLIRGTNDSALCSEGTEDGSCESSLIPLNHTFVVPGGRFREQYYWDSFWIIEGLIVSELYDIVNATLQNFMDEIENFGFIPNGGRIYYLNRSQPPLFIHMVYNYVLATNDTSILTRVLPLAERELDWWHTNRTINVTSPYTNNTYELARYAVTNSAPRPESYFTDYDTANDPTLTSPLTDTELAELYSELASGAETGWDYSTRFVAQPLAGGSNNTNPALRSLNVRNNMPVDLNSILYKARLLLAELYTLSSSPNATAIQYHQSVALSIREAVLDLFWDPEKLAFYDFNLTSNSRNDIFTAATFYPLWNDIIPDEVLSDESKAFGVFVSLNLVMNRYNGTFPVTFLESGLQWDAPNAWPPHQYIALKALNALPSNVTSSPLPTPASNESTFAFIPSSQLALSEDELPGQQILVGPGVNATKTGAQADLNRLNGTVVNGGNATEGEGWARTLQRELANRYFAGAFCGWYSTGGEISGILSRLSDQELNITGSVNNTGNMFEKFSISDVDSAGQGGEYTVQAGFGWTNGVALWIANNYGKLLVQPECPSLLDYAASQSSG